MIIAKPLQSAYCQTIVVGRLPKDQEKLNEWLKNTTRVITLNQQHTAKVIIEKTSNQEKQTNLDPELKINSDPADAILTDYPKTALLIKTADCVPILLAHYPSETNAKQPPLAVGAIHAGRKGTNSQILLKTLELLIRNWGSGFTKIWLGPHICSNCYEINRATHEKFHLAEKLLWQCESVLPKNNYQFSQSNQCTHHHSRNWFSYRKEGKGVPMNWSGIYFSLEST